MYLSKLVRFLAFLPSAYCTNYSYIIPGLEPSYYDDVNDIPRHLQGGRRYCFNNPHLACTNNRRCCTHVHQKKIWCCEWSHKCGKVPRTCVVPYL